MDKTARENYRKDEEQRIMADLQLRLIKQYRAEGLSQDDAEDKAEIEAKKQVAKFVSMQAALHMPDKIAGGDYLVDIQGLGDSDVNSFIGSQWNTDGKISKIKSACEGILPVSERATSHVNVRLILR